MMMNSSSSTEPRKKTIRHARIELTEDHYQVVKEAADSVGLSFMAYVRTAVLEKARRDNAVLTHVAS
jgi:uncharacterized protein (DUF1778 family)